MSDVSTMTPADLLARADIAFDTEEETWALLGQCAKLADACDPALALALTFLADAPLCIGARYAPALNTLAARLHPDTDAPALARAASRMLAQWEEEPQQ